MTTVTEITFDAAAFALGETFRTLDTVEVRVKSVVGDGPLQTMPLIWFGDVDQSSLETALEMDPTVDRYTRLLEDAETGEWLYRIEYSDVVSDRCRVIFQNGGMILDAQGSAGRWTFRLLFPDRDSLSATVDELEDRGIRIDVRRMVDAGRDDNLEATAALTDAQEEAISRAYQRGYYDVPRRISLEELAAELGISHQALSERLRRANKVLAGEQLAGPSEGAVE